MVDGRKIAGILCERQGDNVIAGIGVNVNQTAFAPEIADRATSLALLAGEEGSPRRTGERVLAIRTGVLNELARLFALWRERGFAALYPELTKIDFLKGKWLSVRQTDDDSAPVTGLSGGILPDGSLDVGGTRAYAGEAHVEKVKADK